MQMVQLHYQILPGEKESDNKRMNETIFLGFLIHRFVLFHVQTTRRFVRFYGSRNREERNSWESSPS